MFRVDNVQFWHKNIFDCELNRVEPVDLVVMFGLLYNLENPLEAPRVAKRLTKRLLLIETQTTGVDLTGPVDSGRYSWQNEMQGIFGIFKGLPGVKDGSEFNMMLYPSPKGLIWILNQLGFSRVTVLPVPATGYEQLVSGKRMMVAAYLEKCALLRGTRKEWWPFTPRLAWSMRNVRPTGLMEDLSDGSESQSRAD
jgi:hypothetical protein